jgi:superfamily II DNA or RNA helicase
MRLEFDRGTLVLSDPPPGFDLTQIPGVLWDARVGCHRAAACRLAEIREHLRRHGVRPQDRGEAMFRTPARWPDAPELRPYQHDALRAWEAAGARGIVVLPTGSGKTIVALAAIASLGQPALCLVPTRVLLDQWRAQIARLGVAQVGCYGDGIRALAPITVATFESAWRNMDRIGNRFGLLVVDEAHHFGAGMRDEALEMCTAARRLGLSATPPDREPAATRLTELLGPNVYALGVADLAGEYLAGFRIVTHEVDLTPAERASYEQAMLAFRAAQVPFFRANPTAGWDEFARAVGRTDEGRRALGAYRRARGILNFPEAKRRTLADLLALHRDARVLVFVGDNETAYAVARRHLVMPITCDIKRAERDAALDRFRQGVLRVLVSAQVLNEGLDVPDADVAVIVAGRGGTREYVQRVGRLLRPAPGKQALVHELLVRGSPEVRQTARKRAGLAYRVTSAA